MKPIDLTGDLFGNEHAENQPYVACHDLDSYRLDGSFTVAQLQAVLDKAKYLNVVMRSHQQKQEEKQNAGYDYTKADDGND